MSESDFISFKEEAFAALLLDEEDEAREIIKKRADTHSKAKAKTRACSESFEEKIICKDTSKGSVAETADNKLGYDKMRKKKTENEKKEITKQKRLCGILDLMRNNPSITIDTIVKELDYPRTTVVRDIENLRQQGIIRRVGTRKFGQWEVVLL